MAAITLNGTISLGSIGTFLAAVAAVITAVRSKGVVNAVKAKVDDTHQLVNSRSDRQDARIEQLGEAVVEAGGIVPDRPPLPEAAS